MIPQTRRQWFSHKRKFARLALVTAVCISVTVGIYVVRLSHASNNALAITGNLITYGYNGPRYVSSGVATYAFFADNDGTIYGQESPKYDQIFAQMHAEGINTLRVALGADMYNSGTSFLGSKTAYLDKVQAMTQKANAAGLYVVFGWWDVYNDSLFNHTNPINAYTSWLPAMKDLYGRLGANPMVYYEPWNEPNNISSGDWQTIMKGTVAYWRQTIGYQGVLVLDPINFANSFGAFSSGDADALMAYDRSVNQLGRSNLAFANHRYANGNGSFTNGDKGDWDSSIGAFVTRYPIIGTEYGYYNNGAEHSQWNAEFFDYLVNSEIPRGLNGAMVFVWRWYDDNSQTNTDATTLSGNGQISVNHLWSKLTAYLNPPVASGSPTPTPTSTGGVTGDMDGNGRVNVYDLSYLLGKWGTADVKADVNHSGTVDVHDLSALLGRWTG